MHTYINAMTITDNIGDDVHAKARVKNRLETEQKKRRMFDRGALKKGESDFD